MNTIKEDMLPPTIIRVRISQIPESFLADPPTIHVWFSNGTHKNLFSFYPDEIMFTEAELIGLTEAQARQLKGDKDRQYLKSCSQGPRVSSYVYEEPTEFDEEALEFFTRSELGTDYYP